MKEIVLKEDYIKLGQALKLSRMSDSGADAKIAILDGKVKVNGTVELQRGKKLYEGDIVTYLDEEIHIVKK